MNSWGVSILHTYVFVYHGVTSLENTPQPMQLCFYFTLSAKKLFQWIFFWLSPFFQRKTMDVYNFLDTDTTFANFFCKITTKWSKTFLCKKMPSEIQHHHDCFCHGLQMAREEIAFTARSKIHSHSQSFRYGRSVFCLPHQPNFSDIFDFFIGCS